MMKSCTLFLFSFFYALSGTSQSAADFQNFDMVNTPAFTSNNFKAIGVGKGGHIWAGTQYGGLYKYSPATKTWEKASVLANVFINDIKTDKDGGVWIAQSGRSGSVGGGGNIDGGINYFPTETFAGMSFYSVTGNGGLMSRNVRSLWIDSSRYHGASNARVWAAQASFITSFNAAPGGVGLGSSSTGDHFFKVRNGLDQAGTPSCLSVGGDEKEVWVMAQGNFGKSQILRYQPTVATGLFRGAYDHTNVPLLAPGFRTNVIYFDKDGRQWIGQQAGGVIVKMNALWIKLAYSTLFPPSIAINNNAITGDEEGNIYMGTSQGLIVFRGGDVRDSTNFEKYTTAEGLPSNNVTGIAVDTFQNRIVIATDGGVSFWKVNKKIKVELAWDHSFPRLAVKPKGVAADGVARLYLKVRRGNDTLPQIEKVTVISHEYHLVDRSIRGTLKKAFELDYYNNEASGLTYPEVERTDSAADGNFWFWYRAPEDFSVDDIGGNAEKTERRDDLKIKVKYVDGTEDSTLFSVMVVRPPLLMVHGLASGPAAWDALKHTMGTNDQIKFIESPLFKYKRALTMDGRGAFHQNAWRLLSGDLADSDAKYNSLQGNIEKLRKMGYAANQVDYVCHSMGGIMIRGAIGWYSRKFFADGDYAYNNYGKGFVHKMIFVNTPHNSSPIADAVYELMPKAPLPIRNLLTQLYQRYPNAQMPFDFFIPEDFNSFYYAFKASDAVRDLQVTDQQGGVNLPRTERVKNHLIIGDVNLTPASLSANMDQGLLELTKQMGGTTLLRIARDYGGLDKAYLTSLFDPAIPEAAKVLALFDWYGARKNFPDFAADGDIIVPLQSETARQSELSPQITKFENAIGTGYNASHTTIMARLDVGERILALLNSPVNNNPAFADVIPANADAEPAARLTGGRIMADDVSVTSYYDTAKISIHGPARTGFITYADSTLTIRLSLKDTVGLAYINVNFQHTDSFRISRDATQAIPFKVRAGFTGHQTIWATAVYDIGDSVKYYVDTLSVQVDNLASLQGFRVSEEETEVTDKIAWQPKYEVKYNNAWVVLPGGDDLVSISFNPSGIVAYDPATASFKALQNGFAQAYFNYKGFRDTVSFHSVLEIPVEDLTFTGKVFLQGAFHTATGQMNTTLNASGILQAKARSQPYGDKTFAFHGREKVGDSFFADNPDIVDWVLVELRSAALPTAVISSRAIFVKKDGQLVDTSGLSSVVFKNAMPGHYYIVIKHRNHLPVRSSNSVDFSTGAGSYDFTTSLASAFAEAANAPMSTPSAGVFAMWGGNANGDNKINMTGLQGEVNDYIQLLQSLGSPTNIQAGVYSAQDLNMDGQVNINGAFSATDDLKKLKEILGNSIKQIFQPSF